MQANSIETNSGEGAATAKPSGATGGRRGVARPGRSTARGRSACAGHAARTSPVFVEGPQDPKQDIASCYATHSPVVQRYVSRICGNELSHDVTQDVFAAFWSSDAAFDPERGSVQSLLLTIGHRRAIDVSRQNSSRAWRDHRYTTYVPSDSPADVDSDMLRGELVDEVAHALGQLRSELRDPIRMAYFEDCTYQQVAARLGIPEGTVKSRIRTGFQQLRELLGNYAAA